jgi:hypothetical protein
MARFRSSIWTRRWEPGEGREGGEGRREGRREGERMGERVFAMSQGFRIERETKGGKVFL